MPVQVFCPLKCGLSVLLLSGGSCLCILDKSCLPNIHTWIFSQFLANLSILLLASWEADVLDFNEVPLTHFFTYGQYLLGPKKSAYHKITKLLAPRSFAVLAFMFSSVALLGYHLRTQCIQWGLSLLDRWDSNVSPPRWSSGLSILTAGWWRLLPSLPYRVMSGACTTWYSVKDSRCCLESFLELLLCIAPICLILWPANSSHLSCSGLLLSVSSAHQDQEYPMGSGMGQ